MSKIVGVGLIGAGWMGTAHSRAYLQAADRFPASEIRARLVVCADELESRAREAKQRFGFARCTARWQDVIQDPEVQVVNITTPNCLHREVATAAAAAGKHVFCEKPVGRNLDETAAIERAARKAGVLNWVGFNYRWAPMVQYARGLIAEGKLGRITHFRGRFLAGYASNPGTPLSWRFEHELSGSGVSGDLLSHVIDMSLFLAGPIKRVVGNCETFIARRPAADDVVKDVTNEDYVGALVQFANGAHGTFEVCRVIQGHKCDWSFEIEGTQGAVSWNFERMNELHVFLPDGTASHDGYVRIVSGPNYPFHAHFNPATGTSLGYDDLKTIEAHHFLQSILANKQGEPGLQEALRVAEVMAAIERTWTSNQWEEIAHVS
ncbi:MAG TPA: Gfo/Idh/MocA family oxidoreductase [Terriglobales bacterium]|nr:Gfo/Idh/MocA family oxidoreductase [Terriglobales bacterium]